MNYDPILYLFMVLSASVFHGITLTVLIRTDEEKGNKAAMMAVMSVLVSLVGILIIILLPTLATKVYAVAFMMLFVMGAFFCILNNGFPLVSRLFIYIMYVAVFMLFVGFANCIAAMIFPNHIEVSQVVIRCIFSVLLILLLKLGLRERLFKLIDDLGSQGIEVTVFSWMLGLFTLAYVIFSALFIPEPGKKIVVLCILTMDIVSIFSLVLLIIRLTERKIEVERSLNRQKILEGELEAEKHFVEKAKAIRHDQRHHDRIILEYLEAGRIDEAKRYLGALDDSMKTDRLISWCGNPLFDAQLRIAWRSCLLSGIEFNTDVELPKNPALDDIDFVSVLGNLLENAIEAALKSTSPSISFYSRISDDKLLMEIKNTFVGTVKWSDDKPESTKEGGGVGLESVRYILSRHRGLLKQEVSGNFFVSRVILPMAN